MNHRERQFLLHHAYAMYWHATATTGESIKANISRGREPTEEERAQGKCMGWQQLSNEEKIAEALRTMSRHVEEMRRLQDELTRDENSGAGSDFFLDLGRVGG